MKEVLLKCTLAAFVAIASGQSHAAGPAKEGQYEGYTCFAGPQNVIADGKGTVGLAYDVIGTPIRKEGEPGFRGSERCVGFFTGSGGESSTTGTCVMVDPDGDRMFVVYSRRNQEVGTWKAVSGTGKFDGIESEGTWVPGVVPGKPVRPEFSQNCNKETGRWKLK